MIKYCKGTIIRENNSQGYDETSKKFQDEKGRYLLNIDKKGSIRAYGQYRISESRKWDRERQMHTGEYQIQIDKYASVDSNFIYKISGIKLKF